MVASFFLGVFFGGAGDGSYAPPAIFYGWGIVPWQLRLARGETGFWLVPNCYLVCLFGLVTLFARSSDWIVRFAPVAVHAVGVVVAVLQVQHGHLAKGAVLGASYLIPALVALAYLWTDCRWARWVWHERRSDRGPTARFG
jgi:hypothetical protein